MQVSRIFIHPVKSLKGIELTECKVGYRGFQHDRMYMLATPTKEPGIYRFMTQRRDPRMVLIETEIDGDDLVLRAPGVAESLRVPADTSKLPSDLPGGIHVDIWGEEVECLDVGAGIPGLQQWFLDFMGPKFEGITLLAPLEHREVTKDMPGRYGPEEAKRRIESDFQDIYPGHLIATASLDDLQLHVDASTDGEVRLTPENFRPNIVITTEDPYEEDDWRRIRIGEHEWLLPNCAQRCSIPSVNVNKGITEASREPVPSLNKFRILAPGETPSFGMNMVHRTPGITVRVGDPIEVLEYKP